MTGNYTDTTYCNVCGEHHGTASTARSHERAAAGYDRKYGIAV